MNFVRILSIFICFLCISSCYKPEIKPVDFDEFWKASLNQLKGEVNYEVVKDTIYRNKKIELVKVQSFEDLSFYVWVSTPITDGSFPIIVKYSSFGIGNQNLNHIPNKWFLSQEEKINMVVDIRGQGLSTDKIKFDGYLTKELFDKEKYIYRGAYLDAVKAIDFAVLQPKGDGNIIATGNDQGGTLAIIATALNNKVTMCLAGYPMFTDMYNYDKTKWPMKIFLHETKRKELKLEDLHKTLSYFDAVNFASKIEVPVFLKAQEKDLVTPKESVIKLYESLNSIKEIYIDPCHGHKCSLKSNFASETENEFMIRNLIVNK